MAVAIYSVGVTVDVLANSKEEAEHTVQSHMNDLPSPVNEIVSGQVTGQTQWSREVPSSWRPYLQMVITKPWPA